VTGGGHGIGRAVAMELESLGAGVVVIDRSKTHLNEVKEEAGRRASSLACVHGDLRRERDLRRAVATASRRFGRLDGWVNNAAAANHDHIEGQKAARFGEAWQVNTLAAWRGVKLALPLLRREGGSVVNVSSVLAHRPDWPSAAYISSKAALEGLTRALAVELAPWRIRVNTVVPGHVETHALPAPSAREVAPAVIREYLRLLRESRELNGRMRNPWPRCGRPADVASAVVYLLSDAAEFITGALLPVDGGSLVTFHNMRPDLLRQYQEVTDKLRAMERRHPALDPDGRKGSARRR
jgi:NAD(P)-dependent dehydrogenase (short-subunit alcohol dehydrogenase family)